LTLRTRDLVRPLRFEPQQLADTSRTSVLDEHAQQIADALEAARQEGLRRARSEVDAAIAGHEAAGRELLLAAGALRAAARELETFDRGDLAEIERQLFVLGTGIAESLVGRELSTCDEAILAALDRAMALVPERGAITVRVHPDDAAPAADALAERAGVSSRLEIIADTTIARGGCVVVVGALRIDSQIGPALERVQQAIAR
jgi:flagellar assembly protein FliH